MMTFTACMKVQYQLEDSSGEVDHVLAEVLLSPTLGWVKYKRSNAARSTNRIRIRFRSASMGISTDAARLEKGAHLNVTVWMDIDHGPAAMAGNALHGN